MILTISIISAIVLLGIGIPLLVKYIKIKKVDPAVSFVTSYGIKVYLSPQLNTLSSDTIDQWTINLINFWKEKNNWTEAKLATAHSIISNIQIKMFDELFITRHGMKVNAMTNPDNFIIEIATLPKDQINQTLLQKVESLFKHEVSHLLVGYVDNVFWDNETHHKLFAEKGLGA